MNVVNVLDLVCRSMIHKSLPLDVLRIIHEYVTRKDKPKHRRGGGGSTDSVSLIDDQWNVRGSRYYRKRRSGFVITRVRLKRAFRYGR